MEAERTKHFPEENKRAWNAFFASLALAEKAAADECRRVAAKIRESGESDLADEYESLAQEEEKHHELAASVCREQIPITDRAAAIYAGKYFSENASVIERLVSVHFVFEPSALAFLGYSAKASDNLIPDSRSAQITNSFREI